MSEPEYRSYSYAGHEEFCLSFGAGDARQILIVPPLFDEMNRLRRVLVSAMRDLAGRGVGSVLIDLPGCNESLAELAEQDLGTAGVWRFQLVRSSCAQRILPRFAAARWLMMARRRCRIGGWLRLKGSSLLKTMIRTRIAGEKEAGNAADRGAVDGGG